MYPLNKVYDYSDAAVLKDVIPDALVRKVPIVKKKVPSYTGHKGKVVRAVFLDFLQILMDELIKTNAVFQSPNLETFQVFIREKSYAEQRRLRASTKIYQDVDLIASMGKIYEFVLMSGSLPDSKYRKIRISYSRYKDLVKAANGGMFYYSNVPRGKVEKLRMAHFIPKLKELYPGIDDGVLKIIINNGCHNIIQELIRGRDVNISGGRRRARFLIYKFRDFLKEKQRDVEVRQHI